MTPEMSDVADQTNGCIAMVMGNAYTPDTLLFDHILRREAKSEAIEEYHPAVREHHERFTDNISQSMAAKVEIIYGQKVQRRLLVTQEFEVLPLWGEFEGVVLMLAYEKSYGNCDHRYQFRRIMLLAPHPQRMFYEPQESHLAQRLDKTMTAATRMVRNAVPLVPGYFSQKKWLGRVLPSPAYRVGSLLEESIAQKSEVTILAVDQTEAATSEPVSETGAWDHYFGHPLSNNDLRKLIPPAIKVLEDCEPSKDVGWKEPGDFPAPLLQWFRGQKQILFAHVSISSFSDIVMALQQILPGTRPASDRHASAHVKGILKDTLLHQHDSLQAIRGEHQDIWHSRFDGRAVELCCQRCRKAHKADTDPRWAIHRPGHYIARLRSCNCGSPKWERPVPVDDDILYTTLSPFDLYQPPREVTTIDLAPYLRQPATKDDNHLSEVKIWCIRCKESTEVASEGHTGNTSVDWEPRWVIGSRVLYLERTKQCLRCQKKHVSHIKNGKPPTRFVPVDENVSSITNNALRNFHSRYAELGLAARLLLLDRLPASSREWRKREEDMD